MLMASPSSCRTIIAGRCKTHHYWCAIAGKSLQALDLKTLVYCRIQTDLSGLQETKAHKRTCLTFFHTTPGKWLCEVDLNVGLSVVFVGLSKVC